MVSGVHSLIDGSLIQKLRFENISNNLANINTNGFKKTVISFNETLSMKNLSEIDFDSGPVIYTGNGLDMALQGRGFFKVETPQGIRYTRDGAFTLDAEGYLVTRKGDRVLGRNGPIRVRGGDITVGMDGEVVSNHETVDRMAVMDFEDLQQLRKEGHSYYSFAGGEENSLDAEQILVRQGYLEKSNVHPTEEMIKMIECFRAFESAQKAIQTIDEMTGKIINDHSLFQ